MRARTSARVKIAPVDGRKSVFPAADVTFGSRAHEGGGLGAPGAGLCFFLGGGVFKGAEFKESA